MDALEDGSYDALIIDARESDFARDVIDVELTITSGTRKGEVVSVRATNLRVDSISLLGVPATIVVSNGEPRVVIDRV